MAKSLRQTTMKVKINVDSKTLDSADKKLNDTAKSAENLEKASKKTGSAVKETGKSLKDTAKQADDSSNSLKRHAKNSEDAAKASDKLKDSSGKLKEALAIIGAVAITKQIYELGKASIQVGMDFDKGMSAVKATAGASAKDFEAMRNQAIQLGADTTKSASEVSAGQLELTKSGMSAKQAMAAIPGAISASSASGADMATTVGVMSSALNGFQLKASESAHVADVLAMSANKSKADINDMGYAFKYAATPAKALGMSLEEASAATMIMTNAGLAGEQAGTSLRASLLRLVDAPQEASKAMEQLGVKITDSKGNMKPFAEIMNDLRKNTEGMGNAQKMAALSTIFGTESASGMLAIIDSAPGTMEKFTKSLKESDGASKKASDTMTDNLSGSVETLKGSIESAAISVSDVLTPTVRKGTDTLSDLVGGFNDLSPSAKSMVVWGSIIVGGVIPASIALYKVHKAVKSIRTVMSGAKTFFSSYRSEMQKTGAQALITAGEIQTMNKAMNGPTVIGGTTAKGRNSTGNKPVILDQYGNPLQSSSSAKKSVSTPRTTSTATKTVVSNASKSAKGGFFKNLFSSDKYNSLGKIDPKTGMLKNTFNGGGKLGLLAKSGKKIPIIGTAIGIGALALGGKENLGSNIGSLGGGIAGGAAAGAAIGSIVPGIGTAIGGIVGGIAGSVFGEKFGATVQKKWPEIKKTVGDFSAKHPIVTATASLTVPIAGVAVAAHTGFKSLKNEIKKYDDISNPTIKFGKDVKKVTSEAVNSYMSLESKTKVQLGLLATNGEKYSKSAKDSVNKNFNSMVTLVENSFKKAKDSSKNNLSILAKEGLISDKDKKSIEKTQKDRQKSQLEAVKKSAKSMVDINNKAYETQEKETKKAEDAINKIKKAAADKGLSLSKTDREKIKKIEADAASARKKIAQKASQDISKEEDKQRKNVVASLSKSEQQQKLILGRLKDESGKISARQAASIVKSAEKARSGAEKEAWKQYNNVKKAADEEYYVTGTIKKDQHDKIIEQARKTRDEAITHAKSMKEETVKSAKDQAEGHIKEVNWETGDTLTSFQQWGRDVATSHRTVIEIINSVLKFVGKDPIPLDGIESKSAKKPQSKSATKVPASAIGHNSHPGGHGLVGEEGVELAYKPFSGKATLLGSNGPEIANIEPGTRILNHRDTMSVLSGGLGKGAVLPGYDNGNSTIGDFVNSAKAKASDIWSDTKDVSSAVMDFIKDPVASAKKLFSRYGGQIKNDIGNSGDLGLSIFQKLGGYMGDSLKEKLADFGSNWSGGAGAESAKKWIISAMAITGTPASYLNGLMTIAKKESGFNPSAINLWDSNAKAGHPSQGLFQTIPSTFAAYRNKSLPNDITNPIANAVSAINYMNSRYGGIGNVPGLRNLASGKGYVGYKNGGRKLNHNQVIVGEEGAEIVDLPFGSQIHNNRKTNEMLNKKDGSNIIFNPTIQITIQSDTRETNETTIQRAVNAALERAFKDFRSLINSGVAY